MRISALLLCASMLVTPAVLPSMAGAVEMGADCAAGTDYAGMVRKHESGGDYGIVSSSSSATGAYQFMFGTLKELGYVAGGDGWSNAVWTGKGGVHSREQFLGNSTVQDAAFEEFTSKNLQAVEGKWTPGQTVNGVPLTEGGVALAVHMLGAGGFQHWASGGFSADSIMSDQAAANGGAATMQNILMKRLADGSCTDPNNIIGGSGGGSDNIGDLPAIFLMPWQPKMRAPIIRPGTFHSLSV